jgi:hypothetical protein
MFRYLMRPDVPVGPPGKGGWRSARLGLRVFCAALLAILISRCLPPALAQSPNYAELTQTTVSQLIAAIDFYRRDRSTEAQALLRSMGAGPEQLKGITKGITGHYRKLANAERGRCMQRVVELAQRTSDQYQELQQVAAALSSMEAEIVATTAKMQVADHEVQRVSASMRNAVAKLEERERKLKKLQDWWWVPGYGQYLAVRTLAEQDIETSNSLANGLRDNSVLIQDQQHALTDASEARQGGDRREAGVAGAASSPLVEAEAADVAAMEQNIQGYET